MPRNTPQSKAGAKPLLAYAVTEPVEGTGGVVFALSNAAARRRGARLYADGDFAGVDARRVPEFDVYAPGPVPQLALVDAGWSIDCHGCEAQIHANTQDDFDDEAAPGETPREFAPVEDGDNLYCSKACRTAYLASLAARQAAERRAIKLYQAELLSKLPGVSLTDAHVYVVERDDAWIAQQVKIGFRFPGAVHGDGHYRFDKADETPHVTVCHGDLEAWNAWRGKTTETQAES